MIGLKSLRNSRLLKKTKLRRKRVQIFKDSDKKYASSKINYFPRKRKPDILELLCLYSIFI